MKRDDWTVDVEIRNVRTHNFSALLIHLGMFLWAILRFKRPKKSYNHVEVTWQIIKANGRAFDRLTSGARSEGVKRIPWRDYVARYKGKYFKYFAYRVPLSLQEWVNGLGYLDRIEGVKYEYANFFYHTIKIFTGIWAGSKTTRQAYCLEHAIRFLNATGKYELNPYMNPYEFEEWADKNLPHDSKTK